MAQTWKDLTKVTVKTDVVTSQSKEFLNPSITGLSTGFIKSDTDHSKKPITDEQGGLLKTTQLVQSNTIFKNFSETVTVDAPCRLDVNGFFQFQINAEINDINRKGYAFEPNHSGDSMVLGEGINLPLLKRYPAFELNGQSSPSHWKFGHDVMMGETDEFDSFVPIEGGPDSIVDVIADWSVEGNINYESPSASTTITSAGIAASDDGTNASVTAQEITLNSSGTISTSKPVLQIKHAIDGNNKGSFNVFKLKSNNSQTQQKWSSCFMYKSGSSSTVNKMLDSNSYRLDSKNFLQSAGMNVEVQPALYIKNINFDVSTDTPFSGYVDFDSNNITHPNILFNTSLIDAGDYSVFQTGGTGGNLAVDCLYTEITNAGTRAHDWKLQFRLIDPGGNESPYFEILPVISEVYADGSGSVGDTKHPSDHPMNQNLTANILGQLVGKYFREDNVVQYKLGLTSALNSTINSIFLNTSASDTSLKYSTDGQKTGWQFFNVLDDVSFWSTTTDNDNFPSDSIISNALKSSASGETSSAKYHFASTSEFPSNAGLGAIAFVNNDDSTDTDKIYMCISTNTTDMGNVE